MRSMVRSQETSATTKDYENHGPIVRNLEDNKVMHMDCEKHGPVVSNLV